MRRRNAVEWFWRRLPEIALAACAGASDLLAVLTHGGAFASVITGNLVLVGAELVAGVGLGMLAPATAVGGFAIGVTLWSLLGRSRPQTVVGLLVVELVLLVGYAVGWLVTSGRPDMVAGTVMLAVVAAAMGGVRASSRCGCMPSRPTSPGRSPAPCSIWSPVPLSSDSPECASSRRWSWARASRGSCSGTCAGPHRCSRRCCSPRPSWADCGTSAPGSSSGCGTHRSRPWTDRAVSGARVVTRKPPAGVDPAVVRDEAGRVSGVVDTMRVPG